MPLTTSVSPDRETERAAVPAGGATSWATARRSGSRGGTRKDLPLTISTAFDTQAFMHHSAAVEYEGVGPAERGELLLRVMNVLVAGIALLLLAPVCLLVGLAVKLTSSGPVFYTQTRVGADRRWNRTSALREQRVEDLGGQPFTILKFRSMRTDAEANGDAVWATKHDQRVTRIGKVLRKTRLDEIPQLINVLRGEMNVVGPRPERPSIVVRLRNDIPEYPYRHRVKPGITGWAQINHSYDSCIEDVRRKVRLDLEYIERQSVWFDLKIMLLTLPVMLFRRGAH